MIDIFAMVVSIIGVSYAIVMTLVWYSNKYAGESACTHDCDQGRNCTCTKKKEEKDDGIQ